MGINDAGPHPGAALRIRAGALIDTAFVTFRAVNGHTTTPNGYALPPRYLCAIPIRQQLITELEPEVKTPWQLML